MIGRENILWYIRRAEIGSCREAVGMVEHRNMRGLD